MSTFICHGSEPFTRDNSRKDGNNQEGNDVLEMERETCLPRRKQIDGCGSRWKHTNE